MEKSVLKVRVTDKVKVSDFTALRAVDYPTPSPYFQPDISIKVESEVDWSTGSPRGPTVVLDMDFLQSAFE